MNKKSALSKLLAQISCSGAAQYYPDTGADVLAAKRKRFKLYLEYILELIKRYSTKPWDKWNGYLSGVIGLGGNMVYQTIGWDLTTAYFR